MIASENAKDKILESAMALERQAQLLRAEQKIDEAFTAYDEAGGLYRDAGEHLKAAFCYASAATCWNIRTGWQPLRNAASRNHLAAREALRAGHHEYARALFLDAALLYEKEGDFANYSNCYYDSKRADAKHTLHLFARGSRSDDSFYGPVGAKERGLAFFRWLLNSLNRVIWGYGERPFRAFSWGLGVIVVSALIYSLCGTVSVRGGAPQDISFFEAFYMSIITYTTVGFGDYLPMGGARVVAMTEALSGIFFAPLFLVGLTRRYLRAYR